MLLTACVGPDVSTDTLLNEPRKSTINSFMYVLYMEVGVVVGVAGGVAGEGEGEGEGRVRRTDSTVMCMHTRFTT